VYINTSMYVYLILFIYIHKDMFNEQTTFSFVRSEFMPSNDKINLHGDGFQKLKTNGTTLELFYPCPHLLHRHPPGKLFCL